MRASKFVNEKPFGGISSFNFTRKAFDNKEWDGITTKARGLYIDTEHNEVVARGYEKFFNLNEVSETKPESLSRNLAFPVRAYVKDNGFLGIVSTDHDGNIIFASKSTLNGDHAQMIKDALYGIYGADVVEKIRDYSYNNKVSFVFEVINKEQDPHIIKYKKNECILLDIIRNDIKFEKLGYESMCDVAKLIGLEHNYLADIILDYKELSRYIENASSTDFKYQTDRIDDECIEGFVFEDANGFMFKLKTHYYNEWKMLRGAAVKIFRSGNINFTGALQSVESNYFYGWCREKFVTLTKQERWDYSKRDIISLRDEFRLDKSHNE